MRHGRHRQGGGSAAIAIGIGGVVEPIESVGSLALGDEIISRRNRACRARRGAFPGDRGYSRSPRSCSSVRRRTAPQVTHFAIAARLRRTLRFRCGRCALRSDAQRHEWNFPLDSRFCGTEPNRGPSDCRAKDRGGKQHCCQSTAAFRRESIGRLKAADKTASCRNERSLW